MVGPGLLVVDRGSESLLHFPASTIKVVARVRLRYFLMNDELISPLLPLFLCFSLYLSLSFSISLYPENICVSNWYQSQRSLA